jgi:hypothetical protein
MTDTTPPPLPANFIGPEHQGEDRDQLEVFYRAARLEGGTADEIILRGIRAVLAHRPTALLQPIAAQPAQPTNGWPEPFYTKPSLEDADSYGDVQYQVYSGAWKLASVEWVAGSGMPWFHTPRWRGAAQSVSPAPGVEEADLYLNRPSVAAVRAADAAISDEALEAEFRAWWRDKVHPLNVPAYHTVSTHVAWAQHILKRGQP